MYISFHVSNGDHVPISIARTKDEALSVAITRVLSLGFTDGDISTQKQEKLTEEDFAAIRKTLDDWFASKGIA